MHYRDFEVERVGEESFFLTHDSCKLYINPCSIKKKADAVLISSSAITVDNVKQSLKKDGYVFVYKEYSNQFESLKNVQILSVDVHDKHKVAHLNIEATFAEQADKSHTLGFLISSTQSKIYYAGQTKFVPEMNLIECDIALLPIAGGQSMDFQEAAHAVNILVPEICIPYKYTEEDFIKAQQFAEIAKKFSEVHIIENKKSEIMLRTHTCGELRKEHNGKEVSLCGWVNKIRSHGALTFVDIRDRYGITQVVCPEKLHDAVAQLRRETVVLIKGKVSLKPEENKLLATGAIEVVVDFLEILGKCEELPMSLDDDVQNTEESRLKYRYLDLRREYMKNNLIFRSKVTYVLREFFSQEQFLEIETPTLIASTPEGARDFVVPSRIHKGKFYALPQSPQIYKQLCMVSGLDKYFQIARCYRDEDLRADRQPEFTQIDVEMSFVEEEDVYAFGEKLIKNLFAKTLQIDVAIPFTRLTYTDAMNRFGCDKPDLRFDMELYDASFMKGHGFSVFDNVDTLKCLYVEHHFSRKEIDELTQLVKTHKAKGLAYVKFEGDTVEGPIAKFFSLETFLQLKKVLHVKNNGTVFFVADTFSIVCASLNALRNYLGKKLHLINADEYKFCWITDFPLFEWDDDLKQYVAAHHMFTRPKKECLEFLENDKGKVFAACYDLVLNGVELGSGSLRIHDWELQKRVMLAMNIPEEEALRKFGFLLEAFRYGAPPHGGFALGLDRLVTLMQKQNDIREFLAFPKNKQMESPMDKSPSLLSDKQLDEVHIVLKK